MRMMLVTGGTGGHMYPALALADAAVKRYGKEAEIVFVGNDDRMEATLIPQRGYAFLPLHTSGLVGGIKAKSKAVAQMLMARRKAGGYIKSFQPDIVIGFGGYVSAPVILAAHSLGVKTMIHEQNSIMGKANELVLKKADAIVCCYERVIREEYAEKTRLLGNPRASVAARSAFDEAYFRSLGLDPARPTIMVVMGSLGSSSVNDVMKDALRKVDPHYQVLYVCGRNNPMDPAAFADCPDVHVVNFVEQLAVLPHIDLIICRAGATTLAEVTALGVAAILVPSPYVAHNHQYYNASVLVDAHAAFMIEEKDLCADSLNQAISAIMDDPIRLEEMKVRARELGKPNACADILDWCEELKGGIKK